ncbi:hypothetical protein FE257_005223 [Aspergillus nanangensis]|uniref:Uncharacterized protein n=1 Tax=Aspergillus nanangensis TaxID=2582783 RepID=A0AAD4GVN0_ASPNN|nr:hypothetical protein FE257_005223 [Aspergillus nanangensis]
MASQQASEEDVIIVKVQSVQENSQSPRFNSPETNRPSLHIYSSHFPPQFTHPATSHQPSNVIIRPDADDLTASHEDQEKWNLENLPDILYTLRPGPEHVKSRARIRMTDNFVFGKSVRNFSILPLQISSRAEGWRLEAWMRLDRRITEQDIIDRINPKHRVRITSDYIDYRRQFFRDAFNVADWASQKSINDMIRRLKDAGIDVAMNTTRGLTPGLIDPSEGEAGGRITLPVESACNIVSGLTSQPIPRRVAEAQRVQTMQRQYQQRLYQQKLYQQRTPVVYVPRPVAYLPAQSQTPFPVYQVAATNAPGNGSPDVQYVASCPIIYTIGKKRQIVEPVRPENAEAHYKRQRPSHYPLIPPELALHHGPPARRFPHNDDQRNHFMSLEQYLHWRDVSLNEHLYARHDLRAEDVSRWN